MLRINKIADYGTVVMTYLANKPDIASNARNIAQQTNLNLPIVSKILKLLAKAGLLLSERGVQGGYRLAKPPKDISVAHILSALDDSVSLTECSDSKSQCAHENTCSTKKPWRIISKTIDNALQKISLADFYEQSTHR
ncbi:MAG: SUF system Fe-S cluster assembly regulator [Gammaproteobacteria bacterium]